MTTPNVKRHMPVEFHVSRAARDRYQFDQSLFSTHGSVVFANFHAARLFAQKINDKRDLARFPEQAVRAGHINALGLIDEMLHHIVADYRRQTNARVMADALDWLKERLGADEVDAALRRFADTFPAVAVYRREVTLDDYLDGESDGRTHRDIALEEMLMLWLTNANPATAPFMELFDDDPLEKGTVYTRMMAGLRVFFETQPGFGPGNVNLIDMLRAPAQAHPHSLTAQLEFLLTRWGAMLGRYLYRVLGSLDLIKEEDKPAFTGFGPGDKSVPVYEFAGLAAEPERFTPDRDWMPRLVLIAKNAYVWLDQLSKRYQRPIAHLDQIPDEELDTLARWGITGLWLIGLWERSEASRRIKQIMGSPDAVASAYSLQRYEIAEDLGGWPALHSLKERAWRRGIRLASDMVPNHMGIDSDWVFKHPDWFVSLEAPPFPSYTFDGPDLSGDGRAGIFLEDHYYSRSDAAVVFKRLDRWSGRAAYIYHGNDGTSLPWNDTAQLNYLRHEVREAVIQTILHVARNFSIIRFDAAMTLAKKHYQRLWYPEPGAGGAIASRAEHGLTRAQFDSLMPVEFWRELVDRAAIEAPDTLLLAEAFWLMEGYFVRTLGMHRVYNSAFMNMLRDEDNAKYRSVIKNTIEFDPEILKRYVNFMNNPDERTAVDQFGKGDKYFGVCVMLATMPGLPMFGHGQVEGFTEKYGMEFRRALWDEQPDPGLVQYHERVVFPLLHKRYLFADVRDFLLFDFFTPDGRVDENVFAYSNRQGDECGLVVYHNAYASTRGWLHTSAAYAVKTPDGDRTLAQRTLAEGLGVRGGPDDYVVFRDHIAGLEYIRSGREMIDQGLYVELDAYACRIFLDFRPVQEDAAHPYGQLTAYLNGRGVPAVDEALRELFLQSVHRPFKGLVNAGAFRWMRTFTVDSAAERFEVERRIAAVLREIKSLTGGAGDEDEIAKDVRRAFDAALELMQWASQAAPAGAQAEAEVETAAQAAADAVEETHVDSVESDARRPPESVATPELAALLDAVPACRASLLKHVRDDAATWGTVLGWVFVHQLGRVVGEDDSAGRSRSGLDEWMLNRPIVGALQEFGLDEPAARFAATAIRILTAHQDWFTSAMAKGSRAFAVLSALLQDEDVRRFMQVNRHQDVLWFNQESFEQMLGWLLVVAVISIRAAAEASQTDAAQSLQSAFTVFEKLRNAEARSGYQVEKLLEAAKE